MYTPGQSFTTEEIVNKFGYHKADENTMPAHRATRLRFISFAEYMDEMLPPGRAKSVFFTELETASMWAHKAISESAPIVHE